jgi:hypothetical protein
MTAFIERDGQFFCLLCPNARWMYESEASRHENSPEHTGRVREKSAGAASPVSSPVHVSSPPQQYSSRPSSPGPTSESYFPGPQPQFATRALTPESEEITTPICVVFVGSKPPTDEWIRTKANPLGVRKEKVMNALKWLATHNHLHKDITIDETVFNGHGEAVNVPFHIEHILPSDGIEATTSSYSRSNLNKVAGQRPESALADKSPSSVRDNRSHGSRLGCSGR